MTFRPVRDHAPADPITCGQFLLLTDDHVDGELSSASSRPFFEHIAGCASCRSYVAELSTTVALLATVDPEPPSPAVRKQLTDMFVEWARRR